MNDDEEMHWGNLGAGWEATEAALALVQADLSRTVPGAPTLGFAWRDDDWDPVAFVGTGLNWYHGGSQGLSPDANPVTATIGVATEVQDAIVEGLPGTPRVWPLCPVDGIPLAAVAMGDHAGWLCENGATHTYGAVGELHFNRE